MSRSAGTSAGGARRVAVVANATARRVTDRVLATLARLVPREDLFVSANLDDARRAAEVIGERAYDAVLFGGGDGTVVAGVTALRAVLRARTAAGSTPPALPAVGVLRLGTGNAFADATRAGPASAHGFAAAIARARAAPTGRSIPLLDVLGSVGPFCGFGVDAQILEDHEAVTGWLARRSLGLLARGALGYAASVTLRSIPRFVARRRAEITVRNLGSPALRLGSDGAPIGDPAPAGAVLWSGRCTLAACSTIPYFGLGLRMFPFAEARPDRFHLRAGDPTVGEILRGTPAAFRGTYFSPRVHDWLCDRVALELAAPEPFELGGDLVGRHDRVEVALGPRVDLA